MTRRGYGDSETQGRDAEQEPDALKRNTERSIAGVQGAPGREDGSEYRAGSAQGGAAAGQAMTTGGTGGYGGGFDQAPAAPSGQVADESRSFEKAEGVTPQRGGDGSGAGTGLTGPKGDPAEGSRDQGATGEGPLDTGPA